MIPYSLTLQDRENYHGCEFRISRSLRETIDEKTQYTLFPATDVSSYPQPEKALKNLHELDECFDPGIGF